MPRLKKKYLEKYAQPQTVAPDPVGKKPPVQVINMTLRDTATRHGVPIKTIRTLTQKYGIDNARMESSAPFGLPTWTPCGRS
jgi:hypothetical protein